MQTSFPLSKPNLSGAMPIRSPSVRSLLSQFAVVAFLVAGTTLALAKLAVDEVIRRVELDEMADDRTRAQLAFTRLTRAARQQVEDYAFWSQTAELAQRPRAPGAADFFQRDFVEWLPRNDYEFIELLDQQRDTAFSWKAPGADSRPVVATSPAFLDRLSRAGSVGGFVYEGRNLYLIAGAAIRRSPTTAPRGGSLGYLIIGRMMRGDAMQSLQLDLQFRVQVLPPDTPLPNTPMQAETYAHADSIRAYFRLPGALGGPTAVIRLMDARTDLRRISDWSVYALIGGVLFGAGAILLIWLYGRRLLTLPLRAIAIEIESMHQRGELSEVSSAPPSAEWELFLSTFNDTVRSLRDSEQRYRALFDRAADPYFLIDDSSRLVVDANPAAAALTGVPREKLVGAPLPPTLLAEAEAGNAIRVRRPDGTVQTWGVVETGVTLGDRPLVLAAYRDLTDREALAQSQKMDAIGSLAGGIAHDFNNLMGSVLAGARVARGSLGADRRAAAALDAIEHAGRRAAELTRQLLGVTRHEPLVRVPVDVGAAISNIERMCASTFDRRIRIVVDSPYRLPAVEGDPGQIEQALLNLCINARDAMPAGGTLRIAARTELLDEQAALALRDVQPGLHVVLSVSDDGIGMSDDVKQRIFEPFFTTKARGKGTGLGLAMIYGLARSAGGTVIVDSALGSGSRFDVYLPASHDGALRHAVVPDPGSPPARVRTDRPVVLLADDEDGLREMLRLVLEHEGYRVVEAADGEEAVQRVEELHSELAAVLLDVQMPALGGIEVLARIREIAPDLSVILGTGYVGDAEIAAMREAGADDLLIKPYEMRELLDRLAKAAAVKV